VNKKGDDALRDGLDLLMLDDVAASDGVMEVKAGRGKSSS
jgi:hypothetical protein